MELWSALSLCRDVRGTYRIELWSALGDVRALLPQVSTGVVGASGLVVIAPDSEVRGTGLESRGRGWFVLERGFFPSLSILPPRFRSTTSFMVGYQSQLPDL